MMGKISSLKPTVFLIPCYSGGWEPCQLNVYIRDAKYASRISSSRSRISHLMGICITYNSNLRYLMSTFLLLSLGNLCWWTISPRGYHPPSSQCFYHWVTSVGGLLVPGVSSAKQSVLLSLGNLCWWTISPWGYHPPSSQCFYYKGTYMVYQIYLLVKSTVQNNVNINKN